MASDDQFPEESKPEIDPEIEHSWRQKQATEVFALQGRFAELAMRAPAIAGASGIAAMLATLAATPREQIGSDAVSYAQSTLWWLFLTVLLSVVSPGLAYVTQVCFARDADKRVKNNVAPYWHRNRASQRWRRAGICFQVMIMLFIGVSYASLGIGVSNFYSFAASVMATG